MSERVKFVRVVSETCYIFPMAKSGGDRTALGGRTMDQLIQEFFRDYPLSRYHASRNGHKVCGYEKLVSVQVTDDPPWREGDEG